MAVFKRIDHLIVSVPDIGRAFHTLTQESGFLEAWPIGRFWPAAQTAGVAVGGLNVELVQPDSHAPSTPEIKTIVFEPGDLDAAIAAIRQFGIGCERFEKYENNIELLKLRGFSDQLIAVRPPQGELICRNGIPREDQVPIDFFLCDYCPFLKRRLSPDNFPYVPGGGVIRIVVGTPTPAAAQELIQSLGYEGDIELEFAESPTFGILKVEFAHGMTALI